VVILQRSPTVAPRGGALARALGAIRHSAGTAPVAVGIVGTVLTTAFSWVPSLWFDESATVAATSRSLPELLRMLGTIDSVHGVYYLLMQAWFAIVGYTPFTLRLPSALAIGAAAALLVVLARRLLDRRTALVAGLVFCLLPRTTWMGAEGRSYAVGTLLAVVATLVFVRAVTGRGGSARRRGLWWVLYGAAAAIGAATFLYLGLLIAAHGIVALGARRLGILPRTGRSPVRGWLLAAGAAGALLLPLALLDLREAAQISWIQPLGGHAVRYTLVGPWFLDNVPFAVAGWVLILLGTAALVLRALHGVDPRARLALVIALPWLLVPIGVLVAVTVLAHPVFSPRYVAFSAPAVALLIAAALTVLRRRWIPVLGLALCLGLTLPSYLDQRTVTAKQDSSWAQVAELLTTERAREPAGQRDAVVYGPLRNHPDATMQVVAQAYPAAFRGLVDLKAGATAAERGTLWQGRIPLADAHPRLQGAPVIWLVTSDKRDWRPGVTEQLAQWGYRPATQWHSAGVNVVRYVR